MSKRAKTLLIIGCIVLLGSIAVYLILSPTLFPSTVLGLCFLLYSEIVFFVGFILIDSRAEKSSKLLSWAGMGVSLGIYTVTVFASSLFFMRMHTAAVRGFLVFQIILLVLVLTVCLIIRNLSSGLRKQEEKVLEAGRTVQYAIDQLTLLREQAEKKTDVDKVIEDLRFSDISEITEADAEICNAIDALQTLVQSDDEKENEFSKALQDIELLIKKRNLQVRALKQGGI